MTDAQDDDQNEYAVVVNHEERYSIWQVGLPVPAGWHTTGFTGPKTDCLAHIDEVWTDMRPKSLRERMDATRVDSGGAS